MQRPEQFDLPCHPDRSPGIGRADNHQHLRLRQGPLYRCRQALGSGQVLAIPKYAAEAAIVRPGPGIDPQMRRQPVGLDLPVELLRDRGIGMAVADKGAKTHRLRLRLLRFCQIGPRDHVDGRPLPDCFRTKSYRDLGWLSRGKLPSGPPRCRSEAYYDRRSGSHDQEIGDILGQERQDGDRIRNIAHLDVTTYGWTFRNHRQEPPANDWKSSGALPA